VYQAHAYGWWLKHCDSHLGSLQGKQTTDHLAASRRGPYESSTCPSPLSRHADDAWSRVRHRAGGGFPCMSGDKHGAQPVTCEYFGGEHECGIRKCR
jgi:hypothetical protein